MRHAVVAGGGAALAQPVIRHYLEQGWKVTAVCRTTRPQQLEQTYPNLLQVTTGEYPTLPANLLVTMCGVSTSGSLRLSYDEDWERSVQSNLMEVVKALRQTTLVDGSNVMVVGSIQARNGYGCAAYAATKAALSGLVSAAALEWAKRDVRVNLLELGYVHAGMGKALPDSAKDRALRNIPLGRFATEDEVLHAVRFLAETTYMTGNTLTLAGGMK